MCVVSMVMDQGWKDLQPYIPPQPTTTTWVAGASQAEVGELRRKVEALERMLKAAKLYDEALDQPDCELEEKKQQLRDLSEQLGVPIEIPE